MKDLQKIGGIASLIEAAVYVVGFALYFAVLDPTGYDGPVGQVEFLADNRAAMQIGNLVIYIFFSIFLVVLAIALHERLRIAAPATMKIATAFGLIWAGLVVASGMVFNIGIEAVVRLYETEPERAATVWQAIATVQEGLGGGNEIVGGIWILLLSRVALQSGVFSRPLNSLGVGIGIAGILTMVPGLQALTAVFGLGQIAWFAWLGIAMLRGERDRIEAGGAT